LFQKIFSSKIALLYLMSFAMPLSFAAWNSLLNNFVIEKAGFDGSQIGILQSLREVPGFLAFTLVFVLYFISQQRMMYLATILLGIGTLLTGFFPSSLGLYTTTIIMSIGFHYLQTLNQSLSLQWISKEKAPLILGKITSIQAFSGLGVYLFIYFVMGYFKLDYKSVYALFGGMTVIIGLFAWIKFEQFQDVVIQEKKLIFKKEYWLFYVLTFFSGARRQIFTVFAGFLLVEKFGVNVHHMVVLLFINSILNIYFAPKVGRLIVKFGEAKILKLEYFGLVLIFISYAFVNNLYVAYGLYIIDNLFFAMAFALKTYFQKIADPKDLSSSSAVSFTINHIAAVLLPFVLGFLWLHSASLVFILGSLIAVGSFIFSFFIPNNPKMGVETRLKEKNSALYM
jgi:MFS family permease